MTSGSGATGLSVAALLASLDAGCPTSRVPVDAAAAPYGLPDLIGTREPLRQWLLRHRFWAELAQLDPAGAALWRLLAARQRADTSAARGPVAGVTAGQLTKLKELWPSVQAAFFERVVRGEAIDQSLLRAWLAFYRRAARHTAHLAGPGSAPLPETIVACADAWERGDLTPALVRGRSLTPWPVLGSGDALVLMGVGLGPAADPRDAEGRTAVRLVLAETARYRAALPRPGRTRLRLLATAETMARAGTLAAEARCTAPGTAALRAWLRSASRGAPTASRTITTCCTRASSACAARWTAPCPPHARANASANLWCCATS
ncbi:hypothetical protein LO762_09360 [Actinocorallia sp. API 0066]|uniref:hypothetical protein n=1 Tax=Actinocorallia sp. API 0066 TaxID=2896846 RepID=UPI001E2BC67F|nr:hypothetical protein [Actinocorallia sp. API 0066]MCD0449396.1 hypothetical protein [Actinocorallia sp. API 0066]